MKTSGFQEPGIDSRQFGMYLRQIRENRGLSLAAVEEMSIGLSLRVTKSHLSRLENGLATASLARMYMLSRIYGISLSSLASRFELCLTEPRLMPGDTSHTRL